MEMKKKPDRTPVHYVDRLPDLMRPGDYGQSHRRKIRVEIRMTDKGVEILGDSMYPVLLEELFTRAGARKMKGMLCG